ncbi:MAG TPA: Xaa-Pro aminopeptidase [Polyangiaceae bacterium]|nr:Xaa-Pro aminopeptidase [Polyangiaceae bacterium]
MWPNRSPKRAFIERRARLEKEFGLPLVLGAGLSPPRHFPHNRYPFRAESHFLYFVGLHLEGAALGVSEGISTLYCVEPDPEDALWTGDKPSLADLEQELGLPVRPITELPEAAYATLPPQDRDSADWLSELIGRDVEAAGGARVSGTDLKLAELMIEIRLRNDSHAIAQMDQAAVATVDAHLAGMAATRPGMREAAVRAAMEASLIACGMTTSYNSIVTRQGQVLHNERHDGELLDGDLLLADVGAETPEGWAGDVTRTWPVSGRMSSTQRAIYSVVLAAQAAAIDAVAPGVRYLEVHRAAGRELVRGLCELGVLRGQPETLFERGAAALFFPHGVGHLLGLDVHDMEDLGDRAGYAPGRSRKQRPADRYLRLDRDLEAGMIVTIEPGFYQIPRILQRPEEIGDLEDCLVRSELAKFADVKGIRIEDDVLVTDTGRRVLTEKAPKQIADVEAAMG